MEFTWSEAKRAANLKTHGLDFADAPLVFEGVTFTFEDDRFELPAVFRLPRVDG